MAAPPEVTIKNLSGKYFMDKTLSPSTEPTLALQGVSWIKRKAIGASTVTLHVTHEQSEPNKITIIQTVTGGFRGTTEVRTLGWEARSHEDHVFGSVVGKSRFLSPLSSLDEKICTRTHKGELDPTDLKFLKGEILAGGTPSSFLPGEEFIQSYVESQGGNWTAEQIWGFEEINGKRYYTRRVVVRRTDKDEVVRSRLVYSYEGECELKE